MDNAIETTVGDVYEHRVYEVADNYYNSLTDAQRTDFSKYWRSMLYVVHDVIGTADTNDLLLLERLWGIYLRLASRYGILPTVYGFAILTGHSAEMFSRWGKVYRLTPEYSQFYKKMLLDCEGALGDALTNEPKTNVSRIFVAKALYGWRDDSAPPAVAEVQQVQKLDTIKRFQLPDNVINDSDES